MQGVGKRPNGERVPLEFELLYEAAGPAFSMGERDETDANGRVFPAKRFEQPNRVKGQIRIGTDTTSVTGYGERDHSWGSRYWSFIDWTFLVLHSEHIQGQCAEVVFGGSVFQLGYIQRDAMVPIDTASLDLTLDTNALGPNLGTAKIQLSSSATISGSIRLISACDIEINHVYDDALEAEYCRALVHWEPNDSDQPACFGWLEWCRRLSEPDEEE